MERFDGGIELGLMGAGGAVFMEIACFILCEQKITNFVFFSLHLSTYSLHN